MRCCTFSVITFFLCTTTLYAQDRAALSLVKDVERQPLVAQVGRVAEALAYLGVPLHAADRTALEAALKEMDEAKCVEAIQKALDPYCLVGVELKSEKEITAAAGSAKPSHANTSAAPDSTITG